MAQSGRTGKEDGNAAAMGDGRSVACLQRA